MHWAMGNTVQPGFQNASAMICTLHEIGAASPFSNITAVTKAIPSTKRALNAARNRINTEN
jgi:hypothetical protein